MIFKREKKQVAIDYAALERDVVAKGHVVRVSLPDGSSFEVHPKQQPPVKRDPYTE